MQTWMGDRQQGVILIGAWLSSLSSKVLFWLDLELTVRSLSFMQEPHKSNAAYE